MNIEKMFKNTIISVICQVFTSLLLFINRRIFILFLNIEYLGYQNLFTNIFSLLSIAEFGIANIIAFHLYKEVANKNTEKIGKLIYIYKWIYRFIAMIVFIIGISMSFFLRYILKNPIDTWDYLYLIYFLQLISVVLGYFMSYNRIIYMVDQKEYICVKIDMYVQILIQLIQIATLFLFKNYLIYLVTQLSSSLFANYIIKNKSKDDYPYIKNKFNVSKEDILNLNIIKDIKNFFIHKIAYIIYSGTDNIVISSVCGIREVALYGNYNLIRYFINQLFFNKLLNPIQATIGNIIYRDNLKEKQWKQFEVLDIFTFYFSSYLGLGFIIFLQPFIELWIGKEYLLSKSFLILFSITIYLNADFEIVYKYRSVFGKYEKDKKYMIYSAIINLFSSIILAEYLGVPGVQIGTIFGFLAIAYGRSKFVVKEYFNKSLSKYFFKHIILFLLTFLQGFFMYYISSNLKINFIGFLIRLLVWICIPFIVNTIIYFKNRNFKIFKDYIYDLFYMIRKKIIKSEF